MKVRCPPVVLFSGILGMPQLGRQLLNQILCCIRDHRAGREDRLGAGFIEGVIILRRHKPGMTRRLQARVDRLAFERQDREYAFVYTAQWLMSDEPGQRFMPKCEFALCQ